MQHVEPDEEYRGFKSNTSLDTENHVFQSRGQTYRLETVRATRKPILKLMLSALV
jgi:hypothetical protein